MTPPLPSPPMTAPTSFIFSTTFTSPTAAAKYCCPCFCVTSLKARVEERLLTVGPGVCFKMKSATETKVYSSPNNSPSSLTKTRRSTSGSTTTPKSQPCSRTKRQMSVKFWAKGSGVCANLPVGSQFSSSTSFTPSARSIFGMAMPPVELTASTATLKLAFAITSLFTKGN